MPSPFVLTLASQWLTSSCTIDFKSLQDLKVEGIKDIKTSVLVSILNLSPASLKGCCSCVKLGHSH
jgi:hypothetical protein